MPDTPHQSLQEQVLQYLQSVHALKDSADTSLNSYLISLPDLVQAPPNGVSLHDFRRLLKEALQLFSYYQNPDDSSPKGPTLFQRLEKKRLLKTILSPSNLKFIKSSWDLMLKMQKEKELRQSSRSYHDYPLAFHRDMLKELLKNTEVIHKLSRKHKIEEKWTIQLQEAINLQIAYEFVAAFPEFIDPFGDPLESTWRILIYEDIYLLLSRAKGTKIKQLAIEITAVICSLPKCLQTKHLEVLPIHIKDAIRDEKRMGKRRLKTP